MLLLMPVDVLTSIFINLSLEDIRHLILTCQTLRNIIINDNVLWRLKYRNKLILQAKETKVSTRQNWFNKCRISHNWCKGFFRSKVILQHRINFMPWIKFHNSEVLLLTVGNQLRCYGVHGFPNCNNLLWMLEVPRVERNDIRTNDITRFVLNDNLLVCGNRDGSTAVYKVDNIKSKPKLIQLIDNCHEGGQVEVTAVELIRNDLDAYIVTASNDSSNVQLWHTNRDRNYRDSSDHHIRNYKNYKDIILNEDIGVRCLAVNEKADKLAIGPNGNSRPLLLDTITGQLVLTSDDTKNRKQVVRDIQWHNENNVIYVTHSGFLELMDIRSNVVVYTAKDPFQTTLYCVKTDGHRAFIVGSSEYSRCVLFDWRSSRHVQMYFTQKNSSPVYSLDFNSTKLVTAVDRGVAALNFDVQVATTYQKDYSDIFHS